MLVVLVLAQGTELLHLLICAEHDVRGLEATELITDERPPGNHNDHWPRATTLRRMVCDHQAIDYEIAGMWRIS